MHNLRKLLTKEQMFTIPNFMSLFRLALVPFILWIYLRGEYGISAALVLLSALTDVFDGIIARKFGMVSDLGKVLDPFCDKVTHIALLICLLSRYRFVWVVIGLFVVKELVVAGLGALSVKRGRAVAGAKWYGKLSTVVFEVVMIALMLFPSIPPRMVFWMLIAVCAVMAFAMIMYVIFFVGLITRGPDTES